MYDVMQFFGAFDGHPRAAVAVEKAKVKVLDGFFLWVSCELVVNERRLVLVQFGLP